jgi:hypothetical protein
MAVCPYCNGEMKDEISCLPDPLMIGDAIYEPIRWGGEPERKAWRHIIDLPCQDCHTPPGGIHHPGCCVEQCPACLGQILSCACIPDPDDEELDDVPPDAGGQPSHRGRRKGRCAAHRQPQHYRT